MTITERTWIFGRWILVLAFASGLWSQSTSADGRLTTWFSVGHYKQPDCPGLTVFTVIVWRVKICWGRARIDQPA